MKRDGDGSAMPMLAERRQKVRYILNPRRTSWTNDTSRFGLKYMEKLGWKAGQGIGANLQGLTDSIKVSVRSDFRGLGFKGIPEDVLTHQDNYSSLLAQLATNTPPAKTETDERNISLELKSRQSRARVHYSKFTRSKDVSRYSGNDLSCILGKPAKASDNYVDAYVHSEPSFIQRGDMHSYFKKNMKANRVDFVSDGEANNLKGEGNLYMGFGFNKDNKDVPLSHISTLCPDSEIVDDHQESNEYLTKSRNGHKRNNEKIDECEIDFFPQVGNIESAQLKEERLELHKSSKKLTRKVKKNITGADFPEKCYFTPYSSDPVDNKEELNTILKIKGKKNDECMDMSSTESFLPITHSNETTPTLETEEECNENIKKSKKKRKKNDQCLEVPASESFLASTACSETVYTKESEEEFNGHVKKYKKKRKKNDWCTNRNISASKSFLPSTDCSETAHTMETKKEFNENINKSKSKTKHKKNDQFLEVPASESSLPITHCTETAPTMETEEEFKENIKSKKKHKKKDQCLEVPASESSLPITHCTETALAMETEGESIENINKSKKKHKKKDQLLEVPASESSLPITHCTETAPTMKTEEEFYENINKSKKKHKKNDQFLEVPASESSLPITHCTETALAMETEEESNENINKSKKKHKKKDQCLEVPASESSLPITHCTETALAMETEEEFYENIKKSKKKHKKKDQCLEVSAIKSCLPSTDCSKTALIMETGKKSKKKHKKNGKCLEMAAIESCLPIPDSNETSIAMETEEEFNESIKKKKFKRKKHYQQKSYEGCEPDILIDHPIENSSPESPIPKIMYTTPTPIIEVDGVKFVNGISDSNKCLQRHLRYSANSIKQFQMFEKDMIMDIFDTFPGSNITMLPGYTDGAQN